MPFIVDFGRLHGRAAARSGLDVRRDDHWWAVISRMFGATLAAQGLDPGDDAPFDDDGPRDAPGEFSLIIDEGVWMAHCPSCDGYTVPRRGAARHICYSCWHGGDPRFRAVTWPTDLDDIEAVLLRRPQTANRNWRPPETLDDLRRENAEHGVD